MIYRLILIPGRRCQPGKNDTLATEDVVVRLLAECEAAENGHIFFVFVERHAITLQALGDRIYEPRYDPPTCMIREPRLSRAR